MQSKILFVAILTLAQVTILSSQISYPFQQNSDCQSSYHGLIASASTFVPNKEINQQTSTVANLVVDCPNLAIENTAKGNQPLAQDAPIKATVRFIYRNKDFDCSSNFDITLGFDNYTMNSSEMVVELSAGRYYYNIKGGLECLSADGCQVNNSGIIDIEGSSTFYLTWQVTDYQSCWMTMIPESYYASK